jgi:hypothetical protein
MKDGQIIDLDALPERPIFYRSSDGTEGMGRSSP